MENSGKKMQNKIGSSIKYGLLGEVRIFFYRKYHVTLKYENCYFYRVIGNITKNYNCRSPFTKKEGQILLHFHKDSKKY